MQNVISFRKDVKKITPDDLMSFKAFATKYKCSLSYLYRLNIKRYKRGIYKISENEALNELERLSQIPGLVEKIMNFSCNRKISTPDDLMSYKEFAIKHSCRLKYLYSLKDIKRHKRGIYKISESETLQVLDRF